jgi:membrane dipeptidase
MPFLIDAHQDLAWNVLSYGRDYTLPVHEARRREAGTEIPAHNYGERLCGWPEYQQGQVGIVVASLFATPIRFSEGAWETLIYRTPAEARRLYRQSLDYYHRLVDEHPAKFALILDRAGLASALEIWQQDPAGFPDGRPVGLVLSMEGAECIQVPAELEEWQEEGVRIIGPTWASNQFGGGTREPGPLTSEGKRLIHTMADLGMPLDVSHMDPYAALQAAELHPGPVIASHSNPLALLGDNSTNRHLPDDLIRAVIARGGVIGIVPYNRFIQRGWSWGMLDGKQRVSLSDVADHIDYICQMSGSAEHAGIGSDFDGGFGLAGVPREVDTIADLQKLAPQLAARGYAPADIEAIFNKNWARILDQAYH